MNLANSYFQLNKFVQALILYDRFIALSPNHPPAYYQRGLCLLYIGQLAQAEAALRQAIQCDPFYAASYCYLQDTKTSFPEDDPDISSMRRILTQENISPIDEAFIHFGLAKIYDKQKKYDKSFAHLTQGNHLQHERFQFDMEEELEMLRAIEKSFHPKAFPEPITSHHTLTPIFIVGLPRSGTTLLEQIIASHPDIHDAGEWDKLGPLVFTQDNKLSHGKFPSSISSLSPLDWQMLSQSYLDNMQSLAPESRFITDKTPANFRFIGLIHHMFPHAKIVHITRHPMANALSIYQSMFQRGLGYSYDLENIAHYTQGYQTLMEHWHTTYPGLIHDISYEELVADLEKETRKCLAHIGLEWNDACLNFHQNISTINTVSVSQVRQPLYRHALDKWKNYEEKLSLFAKTLSKH